MVEVAVCFPVFLLILMGVIEFGRAMSVNQMLNSASRIGCRAAILDGSTNSTVTTKTIGLLCKDQRTMVPKKAIISVHPQKGLT